MNSFIAGPALQVNPETGNYILNYSRPSTDALSVIPWRMTFDHNLLLLQDEPISPVGATMTDTDPRIADMISNGIKFRRLGNGGLEITEVPPRMQKAMRFFSDNERCFFPGCELMRAEYKKESEAAKAQDCTTCDLAKVIRKWRDKVLKILDAEALSNSRPG